MNRRTAAGIGAVIAAFTAAACTPPPAPAPEPGEWMVDGQCFASTTGGPDVTYLGPEGELGNYGFHPGSYDGTCTGELIVVPHAVVRAASRAEAAERCSGIVGGQVTEAEMLALEESYGMPAEAWACLDPNP